LTTPVGKLNIHHSKFKFLNSVVCDFSWVRPCSSKHNTTEVEALFATSLHRLLAIIKLAFL
ncbi:MAG TPA: hypothetical protein VIQ31_33645, partial [Phormidium sp.]